MDLTIFNPAMSEGDTESEFQIIGNLFVKLNHLRMAGDKMLGHSHTFDHVTLLLGKVWMRKDGAQEMHEGIKLLVTPAGVEHEFEAIDGPAILCCIHAIRDGDAEHDVAPPHITPAQGLALMARFHLANAERDA